MRVRQLSRDQQSEVVIVDQAFTLATEVDFLDSVLLIDRLVKDSVKSRVKSLTDLFEQDCLTILDRKFKLFLRVIQLLLDSFSIFFAIIVRGGSVNDNVVGTSEV